MKKKLQILFIIVKLWYDIKLKRNKNIYNYYLLEKKKMCKSQ